MGNVALKRGTSLEIRQYGQRLVNDHTQANKVLSRLATAQNSVLSTLEADVEALLVSRAGEQHEAHEEQPTEHEYFLVPIDACFELVGLIRVHWRGFSGGKQAWDRIGDFFAGLRARCLSEEEP